MSSTIEARQEMYNALTNDAPYASGSLFGYHSGTTHWNTSQQTPIRFGLEAEKEDDAGQHVARLYQGDNEDWLPRHWRAERDGSLSHDGFELVSPVYDLTTDAWKTDLETPVLSYLIHSGTSVRCGGHITVSLFEKPTAWYIDKAAQIIPLLYALYPKRAKRRGYARFFDKGDYNARYNAINLSDNKMEIRIFSAIKNLKQLEWRIQLLKLLFTEPQYEDLKWDGVYKDLLDVNSKLGKHIYSLYTNKYGEKVMLAAAYNKAFHKEKIEWRNYAKVRTLIPTGVRNQLFVEPAPASLNSNLKQLTLDVCDYNQERTREA